MITNPYSESIARSLPKLPEASTNQGRNKSIYFLSDSNICSSPTFQWTVMLYAWGKWRQPPLNFGASCSRRRRLHTDPCAAHGCYSLFQNACRNGRDERIRKISFTCRVSATSKENHLLQRILTRGLQFQQKHDNTRIETMKDPKSFNLLHMWECNNIDIVVCTKILIWLYLIVCLLVGMLVCYIVFCHCFVR